MSRIGVFIFILSFTGGVALRSFINLPISFSIFLLFISFITLFYYLVCRAKSVFLVTLCLLGVFSGVLRFTVSEFNTGSPYIDKSIGKEISFSGVVVEEPDERDHSTKLTVKAFDTKILVTVPRYPEYEYGDEISIIGKVVSPKNFQDEVTLRIFDYKKYLSAKGVYYEIYQPGVELVASDKGNFIRAKLFSIKNKFVENIANVIHEPQGSLLSGLIVGAKQSLGEDLLDDFLSVGIIHIVVLSGYNITIIADSIISSLRFLSPILSASLASFGIILFAIMVGGSATVVRASLMALLVIFARRLGRVYDVTTALFIAGFLMLLQNPKILAYDPSFQLSFLATVGLIYFSPIFEKHVLFLPKKFGIRDVTLATISTQFFVLPYIVYKMGVVSIVALPVNLLVLLFIPITMLFGFLTGMIGFLSTTISIPFAYVTNIFLSYELYVVKVFSGLSFASIYISSASIILIISIYIFYILLIYFSNNKKEWST